MQVGTTARADAGGNCARYAAGDEPKVRVKAAVNDPTLVSPTSWQTLAIE